MSRARDAYVGELALTVSELFADGRTDLSAFEIASAHFPDKALGNEIAEGIRKRLHRIRDVLESDFEYPVVLLSDTFFTRFKNKMPTTSADARRCLPTGYGKSAAGIHLNIRDGDIIYEEALRLNMASGAGKVKRSADRTLAALEGGRITEEGAGQLLADAGRRAAPDHPEIAERVTRALPEPVRPA